MVDDDMPEQKRRLEAMAVVILTKNEEKNLQNCLDRVPSKLKRVIVDSGSADKTIDIAKLNHCEILRNSWSGFADQRNFALLALESEYKWILFIDADEIYSSDFFKWAEHFCNADDTADVVWVSQTLWLNGVPLKFAPGYPIYHPRLVRTATAKFINNASGHGETVAEGMRMKKVDIPYDHYFVQGSLIGWLKKHIDLSRHESKMSLTKSVGHVGWRMMISRRLRTSLFRPPLRFLFHYIVCMGFRDGRAGLKYSMMYAWYELTKWLVVDEA